MKENIIYTSEMFEEAKKYWAVKLSGELNIPDLIGDFPGSKDYVKASCKLIFTQEIARELARISKNNDLSLYVILVAVFKILLHKFTGQDDIVILSPTLSKSSQNYNKWIALRDILFPGMTFKEFLIAVKDTVVNGYKNQFYPIRQLIKFLNIADSLSLFKFIFLLENIHPANSYIEMLEEHENDIVFSVKRNESHLQGFLIYNSKLFKKETMQKLCDYYNRILARVLDDTNIKISDINMMTPGEKEKILVDFNRTGREYPKDKTLYELFAEQVAIAGDRTALVSRKRGIESKALGIPGQNMHVTYNELNRESNQLAHLLKEKGVKPDTIAAIMVERSLEMIVGILAILKAGGSYLLIDPEYPEERILYMLKDSNAQVLVVDDTSCASWLSFAPKVLLNLSEGHHLNFPASQLPSFPASLPSSLAYVIYTSGSTGKPKGVLVEHRNVVRLVKSANFINVEPGDRLLLTGAVVFDIITFEIWAPLLMGFPLVLADEEIILDAEELEDFITENKISILHLIPQLFNQLASGHLDIFAGLNYLLVGGDVVRPGNINRLRHTFKEIKILHMYGPTENTTFSTFLPVEKDYEAVIPIGSPVSNSMAYIMDKTGQLLSIGVVGELYLGGDGVSRGYLNNPEQTKEKFLKNPFVSIHCPSSLSTMANRLYRSGDLSRWLPDGTIEFIGRIDQQVKIKGIRIELAEIENQLLANKEIKDAVVVAGERSAAHADDDRARDKYLCAYLVSGKKIDSPGLREDLAVHLPGYMIPSYFMQIEKIPLTPGGKVDRKALPQPGAEPTTKEYIPPGNEIEETIAQLWQEVLGVERVGITDNFFEIGGDSINAIQISARLKTYGIELKMNDLFLHPMIKELDRYVKRTRHISFQGIVTGKVELTPPQKWFWDIHFTHKHHFNQCVMLHREKKFDETILEKVFKKIVEHHDGLRMVYDTWDESNAVIQRNRGLDGKLFDFEIIPLIETGTHNDRAKRIETEAQRIQQSIDLKTGPLVKLVLFKTPVGDHLLIVIHHLVVDGISWRILFEDFSTGYKQLEQGEEIRFQEKTDSYRFWAQKLMEYAAGDESSGKKGVLRELDYWKKVEAEKIERLARDYEITGEKRKIKYTESITVNLKQKETEFLLKKVNWAYNTEINDILLTALGMSIKEWAGVEKVLIDLEGHGRESIIKDVNISRTIGWFSAQYPVVLDMKRSKDLSYVIGLVKETLRQIPNKGIGYGILRYLTPAEKKDGLCFNLKPEIVFNYLGQFGQENHKNNKGRQPGKQESEAFIRLSPIGKGDDLSPEGQQLHAIEINGIMVAGRLSFSFTYNKFEYKKTTLKQLAECYQANLIKIINHCLNKEKREITPSDVGYNKISLEDLRKITKHINKHPGKPAQGIQYTMMSKEIEILKIYPLAPMQSAMLYQFWLDSESTAYLSQIVCSLTGEVDIALFERSLNILIKKYDVLRTVFLYEDLEEPVQVVLKERTTGIHFADITQQGQDEKEEYLEKYQENERRILFNLTKDLLIRVSLIKTGLKSYRLIWSLHHILVDGWSLGIIFKDLIRIYISLKRGEAIGLLTEQPYRDYFDRLARQDKEKGIRLWREYLEGYEQNAFLRRYGKQVKNGDSKYEFAQYYFSIDEASTKGIMEVARTKQTTLSTVFRTIWGILLQRYNNTNDVVFGAVVSGRPPEIPGIENLVGLFINTIPVRIRVDEKIKRFSQLLNEVHKNSALLKFYEYLPLSEIQANSSLKHQLIDHTMMFQNFPVQEELIEKHLEKIAGFKLENYQISEHAHYEFDISIGPGKAISILFRFNANVYEKELMKKIALHFKSVTKQVAANPDLDLKEIELPVDKEVMTLKKASMNVKFNI